MKQTSQRSIHVIWCDDVRHEMGNKPSLMGVYTEQLVMPMLPASVNRLCAYVQLATPIDRPFKDLDVRILRNDATEPVAIMAIPKDELDKNNRLFFESNSQLQSEDQMKAMGLTFMVVMGPLDLTEDTKWFQVVANTGDDLMESFKLKIGCNTPTQPLDH